MKKIVQQVKHVIDDNSRWTILLIFSLLSFTNAMGYVNLLSVVQTASIYYNIESSKVFLIDNISFAVYIIFGWLGGLLLNWRIDFSIVAASFFTMSSYWIRYFAGKQFAMAAIGSILNSFSQIIILPGFFYIAQIWFPIRQRTFAVGVPFYFNMFGLNFGFLFSAYYIGDNLEYISQAQFIYSMIATVTFLLACIFKNNEPQAPKGSSIHNQKLINKKKLNLSNSLKQILKDLFKLYNIIVLSLFLGISWALMDIIGYIFGQKNFIKNSENFSPKIIGILGLCFNFGGIAGGFISSYTFLNQTTKKQIPQFDIYLKITLAIGFFSVSILGVLINYDISSFALYLIFILLAGFGLNSYFAAAAQSLIETLFPINDLIISIIFFYGANIFSYFSVTICTLSFIQNTGIMIIALILLLPLIYIWICYQTVFNRQMSAKSIQQQAFRLDYSSTEQNKFQSQNR